MTRLIGALLLLCIAMGAAFWVGVTIHLPRSSVSAAGSIEQPEATAQGQLVEPKPTPKPEPTSGPTADATAAQKKVAAAALSRAMIFSGKPASTEKSGDASSAEKSATEKQFKLCQAYLIDAQRAEVLNDLDWKPPSEPYVVAGPAFMAMPIKAKKAFTLMVNCLLMAGDTELWLNLGDDGWREAAYRGG